MTSAPDPAARNDVRIREIDYQKHDGTWRDIVFGGEPVIIRNAVRAWPAFNRWSWEHLAAEYGEREYDCQLNLPTDVPTKYLSKDFTRKIRLREFVDMLPGVSFDKPCYLHQRPIRQFPGLERDVRFETLTGKLDEREPFINMWIGSAGTKSSLHFDFQHGLLAQIKGMKRFYMVDPRESHLLSLIPGVIQKSQVDPENPDYRAFPQFKKAQILVGDVREGDIIYIPVGWWHAVRSHEVAISVNYFFGPVMGFFHRLRYVLAGGYRTWWAVLRDFVRHGLLRVELPGRLYASEPFGLWFYDQIILYFRTRSPL